MRKIICIITIILLAIDIYGQTGDDTKHQDTFHVKIKNYQSGKTLKFVGNTINFATDTVYHLSDTTQHILKGTTVLPGTHNQQMAKEFGLSFNKVTKLACEADVDEINGSIQYKINSIFSTDSTLTVDITIYDNCCYDFLCDISIVDNTILNLIFSGYGMYCDSNCKSILTYKMINKKYSDFKKLTSVMINGNRKTIKNLK